MRRRPRLPISTPEVNLVPLLDMVSLLIQMLLVNAQFGTYSELNTHLAGPGAEESAEKLGLQVDIDTAGFHVAWTEGGQRVQQDVLCASSQCTDASTYNKAGLRALAAKLKSGHSTEEQVIVSPGQGVPFEVVILTMDTLRSDDSGAPLFPALVVGT